MHNTSGRLCGRIAYPWVMIDHHCLYSSQPNARNNHGQEAKRPGASKEAQKRSWFDRRFFGGFLTMMEMKMKGKNGCQNKE